MSTLQRLAEMIRRKEVVLWTGAGFNRYANLPSATDLADLILARCSKSEAQDLRPLRANLMELSEQFVRMRGQSKHELLSIIREALRPESPSLRLHEFIRDIVQINTIVTTNYDHLFEQTLGQELRVVSRDPQVPFINGSKRTLIKVHGDIDDPETVVLTKGDYRRFLEQMDKSVIWNVVKSIVATHSVLFVGYSFGDLNVETLFEDLIGRLGPMQRESFMILPSIPEYQKSYLSKYHITPIEMAAEAAFEEIHAEVIRHLLEDCRAGFVDWKTARPIAEANGISVNWMVGEDGRLDVSEFRPLGNQDVTTSIRMSTELGEKLDRYLRGEEGETFTVAPGEIVELRTSIGDIVVPLFDDPREVGLTVSPSPTREFSATWIVEGYESSALSVKASAYSFPGLPRFVLEHTAFKLTFRFDFKNRAGKVQLQFQGPKDATLGLQVATTIRGWLTGHKSILVDTTTGDVFPIWGASEGTVDSMASHITRMIELYREILAVSAHYKVYFVLPEDFSVEDQRSLAFASRAMRGHKWTIPQLNAHIRLSENANLDDLLDSKGMVIRVVDPTDVKLTVFGKEITIGHSVFEVLDAVVENADEIRSRFAQGEREFDLVLTSRTNNLFRYFTTANEEVEGEPD